MHLSICDCWLLFQSKSVDCNFCYLDSENYNIQNIRWTLNIVMLSLRRWTLNIYTPIVNLTLVWSMNVEYILVTTRQLYRYDAPRMYVCKCKMEAPTWVETWQATDLQSRFLLAYLQNSKNIWVMAFENRVMRLHYLFIMAIRVTTWSFQILENMDFKTRSNAWA
jgi:hypothetical protein